MIRALAEFRASPAKLRALGSGESAAPDPRKERARRGMAAVIVPLMIVLPSILRDPAAFADVLSVGLPGAAEALGWAMLVPLAVLPFAWAAHRRKTRREEASRG